MTEGDQARYRRYRALSSIQLLREYQERFWSYVDTAGDCFEWLGFRHRGYGRLSIKQHSFAAHRVAFFYAHGHFPTPTADHLCNNRGCVNPEHLVEATWDENTLRSRSVSGINSRKTHCIHGHALAGENLRIRPDRPGCRECWTCSREATFRSRERRKLDSVA